MGAKKEFYWVLKLKGSLDGLVEGDERSFEKAEERVYPINMPIMLADGDWNIVAAVSITEYMESTNKTSGKYKVVRIFNEDERKVLTAIHKEFYA
ncbi:MAG: hypothetical protein Q8N63_07075 [Nanoarchaeota archaeon]|nr:hypothetical protein [Nanoarchaeota archaeon]